MRRVMMILLAVLSAAAMSAIGASAAGAVTGTVQILGSTCNVTFDTTGGPTDPTPNSITVDNVNEASGCAFDVKNPATSINLAFNGSGNVTASGTISVLIPALGGAICSYSVGTASGSNTATTASISGSVFKTSGSFLCPNPTPMAMQLDHLAGSILVVGGTVCEITYSATGGPTDPSSTTITVDNVNEAMGCPFDVKNPDTSIDLDFDGSGNVASSGTLALYHAALGGITCSYSVAAMSGSNTATTSLTAGYLPKTSGSFICPDPLTAMMRLEGL